MKRLLKIYTILILIKNFLWRKKHYTLEFEAEDNGSFKRWYYVFKHWGFSHANLEMVAGADTLCQYYSNNNNNSHTKINLIASRKPINPKPEEYDHYIGDSFPKEWGWLDRHLWGRNYTECAEMDKHHFWICPVTLFVLGRYPKHLYIKKLS